MALPRKFVVVPNSATRELWRIAESGEIDELQAVLPRADINARNEHGMTALMRAASHGRVKMVRTLLEHGADPNVTRNDQFTALSLAAFFGHAEIVDVLMGHGAKTDVATRFGTSPQMWATARSFGDVARCLAKRNRQKPPLAPVPVPPTPPSSPTPPPVAVRTLKEPPEIWDLVHEAPREFKAGSAFMARISSVRTGFLLRVAALLIVGGLGTGAVLFWKGRLSWSTAPAPVSTAASVPADSTAPEVPSVPAPIEDVAGSPPREANAVVSETPVVADEKPVVAKEPLGRDVNRNFARRPRSWSAQPGAISIQATAEPETVHPAAPPVVAPPRVESRGSNNVEARKTPVPVNQQLMSPPKSSAPKAKVIQWP